MKRIIFALLLALAVLTSCADPDSVVKRLRIRPLRLPKTVLSIPQKMKLPSRLTVRLQITFLQSRFSFPTRESRSSLSDLKKKGLSDL